MLIVEGFIRIEGDTSWGGHASELPDPEGQEASHEEQEQGDVQQGDGLVLDEFGGMFQEDGMHLQTVDVPDWVDQNNYEQNDQDNGDRHFGIPQGGRIQEEAHAQGQDDHTASDHSGDVHNCG